MRFEPILWTLQQRQLIQERFLSQLFDGETGVGPVCVLNKNRAKRHFDIGIRRPPPLLTMAIEQRVEKLL
jgi:hypothetical protein